MEAVMNLNYMEVIWVLWGVSLLSWLILLGYQAQVTSNEEDQLFLSGNQETQHHEQVEIIARVNSIQPVLRALMVSTGVFTIGIIGYYAWDAARHLM
jgi:hypothetical protein